MVSRSKILYPISDLSYNLQIIFDNHIIYYHYIIFIILSVHKLFESVL